MSLYPKPSEYHNFSSDEEFFEENHYSDDLDSSSQRHRFSNHGGHLEDRVFKGKTSTVSLSDFEREYHSSDWHDESTRQFAQKSHGKHGSSLSRAFANSVQWLERSSKLKIAAMGCVLGLLFAVLYRGGGLLLERTSRGKHGN